MVLPGQCNLLLSNGKFYSLTKDPLSLGIIGLMEIIPAIVMALFAGHIVDQNEKKSLLLKCILGQSLVLVFINMADLCKWVFSKNDFIRDIFYGFLYGMYVLWDQRYSRFYP
jgi:hypothetical protein